MTLIRELIDRGGPVMIAIMLVSVLLYERCFHLLLFLIRARRGLATEFSGATDVGRIRDRLSELENAFRQERLAIDAMITSAPLLGLLGTVVGMIGAFNNLAVQGQRSMQGLAQGISQVLVSTESGLAVAIPAVLLVYYAHRQLQKGIQTLGRMEAVLMEAQTNHAAR